MLNLNNEIQKDFNIPMELVDTPDSITIIDDIPQMISVSVRDRGVNLIRQTLGNITPLKLKFKEYAAVHSNKFALSKNDVSNRLRTYFGPSSQIISCSPDSIRATFATSPGKKVAIKLNADITSDFRYVIENVSISPDSTTLYSVNDIPGELGMVETMPIVKHGLKDSMILTIPLKSIPGMRMIPDKVVATIPVEPLISKRINISLKTINTPNEVNVILFPSNVNVDCLVPMNYYNKTTEEIVIVADYNDIRLSENKIPVHIKNIPSYYYNISLTVDSVEYILEQK